MKKGLEEAGIEATLLRVPETLPDDVLAKMHAPPKPDDEEATADKLTEFDGFLFGLPTRYGMAPAQMKAFIDSTGGLWQKGALVGKPAGVFFSTGTQNGGQETTALTFITQLTHHGMIFVSTAAILHCACSRYKGSSTAVVSRAGCTQLLLMLAFLSLRVGAYWLFNDRSVQQRRGSWWIAVRCWNSLQR